MLLLAGAVAAGERSWSVDLPIEPGREQVFALGDISLGDDEQVTLTYERENTHDRGDSWVEFTLVTTDGRHFASAEPLGIPGENHRGVLRLPLEPGRWGGQDGLLGGDALRAVRELRLRIHGGQANGRLAGTLAVVREGRVPGLALELLRPGLVDRGPWRELHLRLIGAGGERGEVDLELAGQRRPLFLDQPGVTIDGRWHPRGPARWVLRLRPDEPLPAGARLAWRDGTRTWTSAALPALSLLAGPPEPLPAIPPQALPVPQAPAWNGAPSVVTSDGRVLRRSRESLVPCPAPVIAWRSGWTGFRGPDATAHGEAAAIDALLAKGATEIDLLPQGLLQEHGPFRFGLSPWHHDQGGPWSAPQDALASEAPWKSWRGQARELVARARAMPGLARWRLGLLQSVTNAADRARLQGVLVDLAKLVALIDPRPVLLLHPQAVDFAFKDPDGVWFGFEDGLQEWKVGPLQLASAPAILDTVDTASEGRAALALPFAPAPPAAKAGAVRAVGIMRVIDANLFNLDRLELDARLDTAGSAQLYAWVTDEHHHWYQQRLDPVEGGGRWTTVGVDFSPGADWQPVGHEEPWSGDNRRRIRRLGLAAFLHGAGDKPATLVIDRIRRLGWPSEDVPVLSVSEAAAPVATVPRWEVLAVDFSLNVEVRNPYDPVHADVAAEVVRPDGTKLRYPAYWSEPVKFTVVDGAERVTPTGRGGWHWRFAPDAPGIWRWRLVAKVQWRDRTLEGAGAWHETTVTPGDAASLPPVRVSLKDPRWFETADDRWFYPLGINLRSPGDSRQDPVMADPSQRTPAASGLVRSLDYERQGTVSYARWFAQMKANGMNWGRVWMSPWWCGIEWKREWDGYGGLNVYAQAAAARLDRVLELARTNRVYIQLELQNHGMTSRRVDPQWDDNPYNKANGGPCATDVEFFSSDAAWAAYAKRLRYVLARWGWNSHLAAIVLSSEMEFTGAWTDAFRDQDGGHSPVAAAWVKRNVDWFAANDPQRRPISIHFSHPWRAAQLWRESPVAFSNSNAYTGFQGFGRLGGERGTDRGGLPIALLTYLGEHFPPDQLKRPTLLGEWGGHWETNPASVLTAELRTGLWMQAVLPFSGNTGFWWWLWVDATGRWSDYAPIAAFTAGEDPRGAAYQIHRPVVADIRAVTVVGMRNATEHRYYAVVTAATKNPGAPVVDDAGPARVVSDQPGSKWKAERWNCTTGKAEATSELVADEHGVLILPLGRLAPDAAFKLHRTAAGPH